MSVAEPDRFWRAVVDDLGIPLARTWDDVLDESHGIEWTTWFLGARLNVAEACVHRWARELPDREAAVWAPEEGERRSLTWAELSRAVRRLAEALVELGIGEGDAVATFLPMAPEAAIASHACAHIGAIQVPIFSGFAGPAVSSRLVDSEARAVVTADAAYRRGRLVPMKEVLDEALADASSVEHVVVWRRADGECPMAPGRDVWWDEIVEAQPGTLDPAEVESETPYLLAYTSGTTGKPKGALHVQGGFLLSIARETAYQADLRAGDRALFSTDMGWIMGPWTVVGGMACGATIVFMEGAPDWPHDRLWRLVESEQVTMLGISPTLDPRSHPARRACREPVLAALGGHHRRAVEQRPLRLARRARLRRGAHPDRQLLRWHRGRRLLPLRHDDAADEAVLSGVSGTLRGDGRVRRPGPQRAW